MIKVRAASPNPADCHLLRHKSIRRLASMLTKQKTSRPGREMAGEIEAVGTEIIQFKPGDAVFGLCLGAFAEYACASRGVKKLPKALNCGLSMPKRC